MTCKCKKTPTDKLKSVILLYLSLNLNFSLNKNMYCELNNMSWSIKFQGLQNANHSAYHTESVLFCEH